MRKSNLGSSTRSVGKCSAWVLPVTISLLVVALLGLSGAFVAAETSVDARRGSAGRGVGLTDAGATVSLDPSALSLNPGETQAVNVLIEDVVNLYGFALHMSFDPDIVQVAALGYGSFLSPDVVAEFNFDNTEGRIDVGISQKAPSAPQSGTGVLLTISLEGIAPGDAHVSFVEVMLANNDGISLNGSAENPNVVVLSTESTDTPTATATQTVTSTSTSTATPSPTPSQTPSMTATQTATPTSTATPTEGALPGATPYYYFFPDALSLAIGESAQIQIRTSFVEGLAGVGVRVRWDPAKITVQDALPGEPGVQVAPGDLFDGHPVMSPAQNGNIVDNGVGELSYGLLYIGDPPGPDASWTVATMTVTGQVTGTTVVEFFGPDTLMTDAEGVSMDIGWQNANIQVGGGGGPSPTPTRTATPTATPTEAIVCEDLVQNGGFESGGQSWTTVAGTTYDGPPHSGMYSAYLGGYDNAQDGTYQTVTIPANVLSAQLSYWWYLFTTEATHPHDYFYAEIYDAGGTLIEVLDALNDGSLSDQWQQATHDLMAYAGQTVRISFRIDNNATDRSSFYVDDVELVVCAEPTPPATPEVVLPLVLSDFVK